MLLRPRRRLERRKPSSTTKPCPPTPGAHTRPGFLHKDKRPGRPEGMLKLERLLAVDGVTKIFVRRVVALIKLTRAAQRQQTDRLRHLVKKLSRRLSLGINVAFSVGAAPPARRIACGATLAGPSGPQSALLPSRPVCPLLVPSLLSLI